ncbi:MAG: TonB-dependent receptor [Kordia sp.]|nr:MAG: TonB-dependent receptor [Kordia sp.]
MKKTILTLLLSLVTALLMHAQQTTVKGQVIDADSTDPVTEVAVSIKGAKLSQTTDAEGKFSFTSNIPLGEQFLVVGKEGYFTKTFTIIIEEGKVVNLSTIILNQDIGESDDFTISLSEDELDADESVSSNTSGILHASKDAFARAAAFDFSGTFFKVRGLGSENGTVLINGIKMNKIFNGRPQWSDWGGINDVMRNQDFVNGSKANEYTFGGIGGTTNISMRASQYRKGSRVSYASSNRSYTNRVMGTYTTGLMENGWALAVTAGRRWAEEGYADGTVYDANSIAVSAEKKINIKHSINFTGIYTPNRRGKSAAMTQEVFDLKGRKYNSYWGEQNGEIRNSRIKEVEEPILMLNHYWNISDKTTLNTNVSYQFGHIGNSRIDYNGSSPDPTYYKNLPSYALRWGDTQENLASAYVLEQRFLNNGQLNWNDLYEGNIARQENPNQENSVYVLYEDRNDDKQWSFNSILNTELADNISLNTAVNYSSLKSHNYAKVLDLLGGISYEDKDYFDNISNNALTPGRAVGEGDTFKYDYTLGANQYDAFVQAQFKYSKVDFYIGGQYGNTTYQRDSDYLDGHYVDTEVSSLGKGEKLDFNKIGAKGGFTYKVSGKHLIDVNGAYLQDAPTMRNSFLNSRQNNLIVPNLKEVKKTSVDVSYIFRSSILKTRLTGYYTTKKDATEVAFYYIDGLAGLNQTANFVQEAVTGVNTQSMGIEFGAEAQVTPTIKVKGALALGESIYTNNPDVYLGSDDFIGQLGVLEGGIKRLGEATLKDYKVAGGPQRAASIGFEYRDPKYWWFGATVNFFSNAYLDVAPITRTSNFALDSDGLPINAYDPAIAKELLKQEKFDDYMLVNLVGGKSFKFGKKYIGFFASVNNVLNETYKTGGYEYTRNGNYSRALLESKRDKKVFGPRYWFGRGTTYYMNVYLRF